MRKFKLLLNPIIALRAVLLIRRIALTSKIARLEEEAKAHE